MMKTRQVIRQEARAFAKLKVETQSEDSDMVEYRYEYQTEGWIYEEGVDTLMYGAPTIARPRFEAGNKRSDNHRITQKMNKYGGRR